MVFDDPWDEGPEDGADGGAWPEGPPDLAGTPRRAPSIWGAFGAKFGRNSTQNGPNVDRGASFFVELDSLEMDTRVGHFFR